MCGVAKGQSHLLDQLHGGGQFTNVLTSEFERLTQRMVREEVPRPQQQAFIATALEIIREAKLELRELPPVGTYIMRTFRDAADYQSWSETLPPSIAAAVAAKRSVVGRALQRLRHAYPHPPIPAPIRIIPSLALTAPYRDIPRGSKEAITFEDIKDGDTLFDFNDHYSRGQFFGIETIRQLSRDPFTRQPIGNIYRFTARLVPLSGGGTVFGHQLKKVGAAMPDSLNYLQQMTKESYSETPKEEINGWILQEYTPTIKFWTKGSDAIVGVRGTKSGEDVSTWPTVPLSTLNTTDLYKRNKKTVEDFRKRHPSLEYYAVGHSLGGAMIDSLIRDGLIKEAISYNPAIQYKDINAGLPNRRIYYGNDPLYRLMGWWDRKSEKKEPTDRSWVDFLSSFSMPANVISSLAAHKLKNFAGGKSGKKVVFTCNK